MSDKGPLFYTACPECKKKVNPHDMTSGFYCEKCQKALPDCKPTYNFSMRVGDFTSNIYTQVLGENVGDAILGLSAKDLKALQDLPGAVESATQ